MVALHFWFETVPAWFWHYFTVNHVGELAGGWIGWLITFVLWVGNAILFLVYAVVTLLACLWIMAFVARILARFLNGVATGFRRGNGKDLY